ncbi:MAG TPA: glycosyltransferase family 39 protein, partial [Polyangia bacterium]
MKRAGLAAAIVLAIACPLLLVHTGGAALHDGDEAIYAEMAREMVSSGNWGDLTWQGETLYPRPPGAIWTLAAVRAAWPAGARDERVVRYPLAFLCALELALLVILGTQLFDLAVGVTAAGVLLTSDLFIGYARYFESEPLLCVLILGAFICYEAARARPRFALGFGLCLGAALMTKQVVGAVPLLALLVDRTGEREGRVSARAVAGGLAVALAVWLPWHVWALALHGRAFVDGYFLGEVLERSRQPILHLTRFSYYVRELWRSEGPLVLLALAGIGWAAVGAARRRRRRDLLISIWALGGLVAFSLARTRFDYYLLVVYPALALGAATLVWTRLPLGKRARLALAIALIGAGAIAHLARDLSRFDGDDEVRALARVASAHEPPEAELYLYNTHPYSARYYSERKVVTLLESPAD